MTQHSSPVTAALNDAMNEVYGLFIKHAPCLNDDVPADGLVADLAHAMLRRHAQGMPDARPDGGRTKVWPTGTGNTPQDVQLASLVTRPVSSTDHSPPDCGPTVTPDCAGGETVMRPKCCEHKSVHDGPRVDMRWGTAPTQICECGAWRTMLHVPGQWQTTPLPRPDGGVVGGAQGD